MRAFLVTIQNMRTTASWAFWRRAQYIAFFSFVLLLLTGFLYYKFLYTLPTCFDGRENGMETGVDCGGGCTRICAFEVTQPEVQWARSFKITEGQYNAVAYVENRNMRAATPELQYTFSLYDDAGLIVERSGVTVLPPDSVYPIFEGQLITGTRVPTRTFLDIKEPELWIPATYGRDQFTIVERTLARVDTEPRLDAVLQNNDLEEARDVEVVATIFDKERNALTSSRTVIDTFPPRSEQTVVFTWPEPIAKTIRSCEIPTDVLVAIDLSGSMNDDGGTPPQPITAVLSAAERFVSRLQTRDRVGIITFATDAVLALPLSSNGAMVQQAILSLAIAPAEEQGSTNTGDALLRAAEGFSGTQHNENARKVLVLLTDGLATAPEEEPEAYALAVATALKERNVELYVIGLGERVNFEFIQALASRPDTAYQALTNEDVERIYQTITASLCEDGPAVIEIVPKTATSFEQL